MIFNICQWVYSLPLSATVRESVWAFPALECVHIYSMIFLITVVALFDIRLMGFSIEQPPHWSLPQLSRLALKWSWVCLGLNATTGALLFSSKAPDYYTNSAFRIKMMLVISGVVYHSIIFSRIAKWGNARIVPVAVRVSGVFSLLLWIGVIAASRWIAYVAAN